MISIAAQFFSVTTTAGVAVSACESLSRCAAPYVSDLIAYYHVHKEDDCDWVVLPVTSFDMYYGGSYFSKRILSTIPEEILERQNHTGTCRYRITDAFRL